MRPLQLGAASFPAAALRGDLGVLLSCARFGPQLLRAGLVAGKLTAPFGDLIESAGVTDPWLLAWLDLECFGELEREGCRGETRTGGARRVSRGGEGEREREARAGGRERERVKVSERGRRRKKKTKFTNSFFSTRAPPPFLSFLSLLSPPLPPSAKQTNTQSSAACPPRTRFAPRWRTCSTRGTPRRPLAPLPRPVLPPPPRPRRLLVLLLLLLLPMSAPPSTIRSGAPGPSSTPSCAG